MHPLSLPRKNDQCLRPQDRRVDPGTQQKAEPKVHNLHQTILQKIYRPRRPNKIPCDCRAHDRFQAGSMPLRFWLRSDLLRPFPFWFEPNQQALQYFFSEEFQAFHLPLWSLQNLLQTVAVDRQEWLL